ncbi:hypothetical protein AUP68_00124 [Ilyonectria robusta]
MYRQVLLSSLLATIVRSVFADDVTGNSEFTSIDTVTEDSGFTDNTVYTTGEKITIEWTTAFDKVGLLLWQENTDAVSWTVTADWLTDNSGDIAVAFLALYESGSTAWAIRNTSFNITSSDDSSSSSTKVESSTVAESTELASTQEAETETVVNEVTVTGAAATNAATTEAAATDAASTDAVGGVTTIALKTSDASDTASPSSATWPASSEASSGGLSTSSIAGITVGSILSAISALGGFGFMMKRKKRARKAKAAAVELKMQQQSTQSTQIHIQQAAAPSPSAPPAAGQYQQDHKGPYPSTHTLSYAPTHSMLSPVYPAAQYPAHSPVHQPASPPAQWNNQNQGYGQGNNGAYEAA